MCEFCINVLGGLVASAIFIQDKDILKARIAYCLIIIVVLKVVLDRAVQTYLKGQFIQLLENPRVPVIFANR